MKEPNDVQSKDVAQPHAAHAQGQKLLADGQAQAKAYDTGFQRIIIAQAVNASLARRLGPSTYRPRLRGMTRAFLRRTVGYIPHTNTTTARHHLRATIARVTTINAGMAAILDWETEAGPALVILDRCQWTRELWPRVSG